MEKPLHTRRSGTITVLTVTLGSVDHPRHQNEALSESAQFMAEATPSAVKACPQPGRMNESSSPGSGAEAEGYEVGGDDPYDYAEDEKDEDGDCDENDNDDGRDEDSDDRCGCCHDAHDRPHDYDDDGMTAWTQ